jgi:hypothetical protein
LELKEFEPMTYFLEIVSEELGGEGISSLNQATKAGRAEDIRVCRFRFK